MMLTILLFGVLYCISAGAIILTIGRAARIGDEAMEAALRHAAGLEAGTRKRDVEARPLTKLNPQLLEAR